MQSRQFSKLCTLLVIAILLSTMTVWGAENITIGETVSFFRDITIPRNTTVRGNVVSIFGDIDVEGEVTYDVVAIFGRVRVGGIAHRDVVSVFGGIQVEPGGTINRSAVAVLGYGIHNDGIIGRDQVSVLGLMPRGVPPLAGLYILLLVLTLIKQIIDYVVASAALLIFSERFERMVDGVFVDTGRKGLIGLLVYFGTFVVGIILTMTIVGSPLLAILVPALILLEFAGNTTMKIAIGRKIRKSVDKNWGIMIELFLGTLIFVLIELTIIGKLFTFVFKLAGMGEVVDSRFGDRHSPPQSTVKGNDSNEQ